MTLNLPEPLTLYFSSERPEHPDVTERCFAADAVVHDEGHQYVGIPAIKAWKTAAKAKYQYNVEPLELFENSETTDVRARLQGNFPGSPVEVTFRFTLRDARIARLEIA